MASSQLIGAWARGWRPVMPLIGSSLLSAAGSAPIHLTPLFIATAVADGRASVGQVGLIPFTLILGQLTSAITLASFSVRSISRGAASGLSLGLLAGLGLCSTTDFTQSLAGWFCVGLACGSLMYLGTLAASQHDDKVFAFSLRLGLVLISSGIVAGFVVALGLFHDFQSLIGGVALLIAPLLVVGTISHQAVAVPLIAAQGSGRAPPDSRTRASFGVVLVLFVSQSGIIAFALQRVASGGMTAYEAILALASAKICAGIFLFYLNGSHVLRSKNSIIIYSLILIIIDALLFFQNKFVFFLLSLIAFEISFNRLSAEVQGAIASRQPDAAGLWLTAVMLSGAAIGPLLNGFVTSAGHPILFLIIAVSGSLLVIRSFGLAKRSLGRETTRA